MIDQLDLVIGIIAANGGRIVGKTRLQKTVYLLDAAGLNSGFEFEYHNYGPYSSDLATEVDNGVDLKFLETEERFGYHDVPYVIYRTNRSPSDKLGDMSSSVLEKKLSILENYSALVIELAATIHYFGELRSRDEIDIAVKSKKHAKATEERLNQGWELLEKLEIKTF